MIDALTRIVFLLILMGVFVWMLSFAAPWVFAILYVMVNG